MRTLGYPLLDISEYEVTSSSRVSPQIISLAYLNLVPNLIIKNFFFFVIFHGNIPWNLIPKIFVNSFMRTPHGMF